MPPEATDLITNMSIFAVVTICGGALLSITLTVGIIIFVRRMISKTISPNQGIIQNGIPARAKIEGVRQTGMMVNNQPQIVFDLEVQPSGGVPYRAQAKAVIPMVNIPQFQPGADVPIKIHPSDPMQIALDIYQ